MNVTVVIPVFNQEKFISSCIESVIAQADGLADILVVDDGSTDRTPGLLRQFTGIRVLTQRNGGTSSAWNLALKDCQSTYLIGLDADDEFCSNTLSVMLGAAHSFPQADLIYSDYVFINEDGVCQNTVNNPAPLSPVGQLLRLHDRLGQPNNFLPFGHVRLYKRQALIDIGGFDETYFYAEDFELVLRMAERGLVFSHVPEVLYKYRWHSSNKGVVSRKEQKAEVRRAVEGYRQRVSGRKESDA